jgi:hypothetical protein
MLAHLRLAIPLLDVFIPTLLVMITIIAHQTTVPVFLDVSILLSIV